jgi:hypothetical protein
VTPFEFDLFLRWFGPLHGVVERVTALATNGYAARTIDGHGLIAFAMRTDSDCRPLAGFIPAYEASNLLAAAEPGTFLVRFSKTKVGAFALTYVDSHRNIKHSLIYTNAQPPYGITIPGTMQCMQYTACIVRCLQSWHCVSVAL